MKDIEHKSQVALCRWLDREGIGYFAIPNGGARNAITGKRLKDEGVKAGVPDLFIYEYKLFIEMKSPNGKLTNAQKVWKTKLNKAGYNVYTCYSADEAIKVVEAFRL